MPPSRPRGLSRRRFLASTAVVGAATAGLTGCDSDAAGDAGVEGPEATEAPADQREPVALVGLRTPGTGEPVSVTLVDGRITEVQPRPETGIRTRDMAGGWIIPGVIDCHVHMQFADPTAVAAGGVTTVRDLGGPPAAAQALRDSRPAAGTAVIPRVLIAGRILTAIGGYPTRSWGADGTAREVAGPDDAGAAVADQVAAGAVVIKIALEDAGGVPVLDEATSAAIVAAAGAAGLRTTAHVGSPATLRRALAAGVHELCHLPLHDVTPAEMVAVAEAGVALVPTLAIRGADPGAAAAIAAFREAGGLVLYGTDLGNGGTSPGIMVEEVQALLDAGMTPQDVLRAATADPAQRFGLDTGEIASGRVADLVVLGADPYVDPSAYDDVRLAVVAGRLMAP